MREETQSRSALARNRRGDFARGMREDEYNYRRGPDFARGQREADERERREPDYAEGLRNGNWEEEHRASSDYARGQHSVEDRATYPSTEWSREHWLSPGEYTGRGPRGYRRSDERIREDVCERLTMHGQVDASNIEVQVENGEVTLTGTVDSRRAKRMAEEAVETVRGVRDVQNALRVEAPTTGQSPTPRIADDWPYPHR